MNAENLNSDRDEANNTQFEMTKNLGKTGILRIDDAAKVSVSSKKNLDDVENTSG